MCCSVNQIDDLQSSNKKQSWTFRLPCSRLLIEFKNSPSKIFSPRCIRPTCSFHSALTLTNSVGSHYIFRKQN